jgi:hypothetical protein
MRKIVNSTYSMHSEQPSRSLSMSFTEEELGYLRSQPLLLTASRT